MSNYIRITKNPETNKFEEAEWIDHPDGYLVTFPNGECYRDIYGRKWEFKD